MAGQHLSCIKLLTMVMGKAKKNIPENTDTAHISTSAPVYIIMVWIILGNRRQFASHNEGNLLNKPCTHLCVTCQYCGEIRGDSEINDDDFRC